MAGLGGFVLSLNCIVSMGEEHRVLSASIRSVQRELSVLFYNAHICTLPPKVLDQMVDHILTDKGMEIFEKDWSNVQHGAKDLRR